MNLTEFFLARHANTVWNSERRFQGQKDSPLSPEGIRQSKAFSKTLDEIKPDVIFTSKLMRAKETARHAIENTKKDYLVFEYEELNESAFGPWEGMKLEDVKRDYREAFEKHRNAPHLFSMAGAETYTQVQTRAIKGIKRIARDFPEKRVLVVTHGLTLLCILGYIRNIPLDIIRDKIDIPGNTEYIKIDWFEDGNEKCQKQD